MLIPLNSSSFEALKVIENNKKKYKFKAKKIIIFELKATTTKRSPKRKYVYMKISNIKYDEFICIYVEIISFCACRIHSLSPLIHLYIQLLHKPMHQTNLFLATSLTVALNSLGMYIMH